MSKRCLKVWENVWVGVKSLRQSDRRAILDAIFAYSFDGVEPELKGIASAAFEIVRPLLTVYESGKAFSGSLGGAVCGSAAKSAVKVGNKNASKTQAKHKQDTSKTQAILNENENGNNPPLSPNGGEPPSVVDNPVMAGFPERAPAPISREKCIALSQSPQMSVQVPAEFCEEWWYEHDADGWIDETGRPIRGMRRVRQLLAGAFNYKKNNSARAVQPVGGAAAVFDPEACE